MTAATQDAELRERLFAFLADHNTDADDSPIGQVIVSWHKSELSRAVGERTQAVPGAVTTERLQRFANREGLSEPARVRMTIAETADIRENIARETASLRDENATLRIQIAAVEADRKDLETRLSDQSADIRTLTGDLEKANAKLESVEAARAKATEGAAPGFANAWKMWKGYKSGDLGELVAELDRRATVIASQAAELSTLRAALAKAEEEARELRGVLDSIENVVANPIDPDTDGAHIEEHLRVCLDRKRVAR